MIHRRTRNLRAVQLLLGHAKLESIVRYLGIEVDDALEVAEQMECRLADGQQLPDSTVADRPVAELQHRLRNFQIAVAQVSLRADCLLIGTKPSHPGPWACSWAVSKRLQTLVLGAARVAERAKRTCTSAVLAKKRVRARPMLCRFRLVGLSQCVVP